VRWHHPDRGLIMPGEFISVAEESGLIVPVGAFVLAEACRQLGDWKRTGASDLTMSVNLSARQFQSPELEEAISQALDEAGVRPPDVCLEVTESMLMEDADASIDTLDRLRALGFRVAIDDFGTGYSSLSYLRRLPVDLVKIDRSFVAQLGIESESTAIVTAVVHLARSLGLGTVAEGVETAEQGLQLKLLGCDLGQGYHWGRPMPAGELAAWIDLARTRTGSMPGSEEPPEDGRYRVLVADDQRTHRSMVSRVLEKSGRFTVIAQAADGREAVQLAARLRPDIVVLDLSMPRLGGLEALPRILRSSANTKVVLYSGSGGGSENGQLPEGASAYLRKTLNPTELVQELLLVMGADH
jgi:EAL domain-containing protein (putative c-di-GMP-specific phosphodiesterase class I)/CheY-like chemotaxis protein